MAKTKADLLAGIPSESELMRGIEHHRNRLAALEYLLTVAREVNERLSGGESRSLPLSVGRPEPRDEVPDASH